MYTSKLPRWGRPYGNPGTRSNEISKLSATALLKSSSLFLTMFWDPHMFFSIFFSMDRWNKGQIPRPKYPSWVNVPETLQGWVLLKQKWVPEGPKAAFCFGAVLLRCNTSSNTWSDNCKPWALFWLISVNNLMEKIYMQRKLQSDRAVGYLNSLPLVLTLI